MFWEVFYNLCITNGTKPNAVCKELNLSNATSTHWKNGTMPKGDVLIKIADYFDCSVDYLLGRQNEMNGSSPKFVNNATYNGTVGVVGNNSSGSVTINNNATPLEVKSEDKEIGSFEQDMSENAKELLKVFESLPSREQIKLLGMVFEFEEKYKAFNK